MRAKFVYVVVGEDKLGRVKDWYAACGSLPRAMELVAEASAESTDPDINYTWYSPMMEEETNEEE